MYSESEVVEIIAGINRSELTYWVEQGWVRPVRRASRIVYREVDVARVRLIQEIRVDMSVSEENVPLVLSLLDQVHGLRRQLRTLAEAVQAEPDEVRQRIARFLSDTENTD